MAMKKTIKLIFTICVIICAAIPVNTLKAQNIINTLGTTGSFKIKDGVNDYFLLSQSTGSITLYRNIEFGGTSNSTSTVGVITKNGESFIHNYAAPNTSGKNTFIGLNSGNFTMSGTNIQASFNTAVGYQTLNLITTGTQNSAFGVISLANNTTGSQNSAFGYSSLSSNTTGISNSAFGSYSLSSNTTGVNNSAFGEHSLGMNNGSYNSAFGVSSMLNNTSGGSNASFGYSSMLNNTASFNSAFGMNSMYQNTTGQHNCSFGMSSLYSNTIGNSNSGFGKYSLYSNTIGQNNSAFGYSALYANVNGSYNSSFGYNSLLVNQSGNYNTALGYVSLASNTSGNYNIAIGYSSAGNLTTGSNNIVIGYNADVPSGTLNNQVRLGNTSITYAGIQVAWTITSDRRWKSNITGFNKGLDFITKLKPVTYTRNNDDSQKTEFGFIAQEVEDVLKECGIENPGMLNIDEKGMYELRYNDLFAPIVKAIQELKDENDKLKKEVESLKSIEERLTLLELTVLKEGTLKEIKTAEK
jgi:trimeric autotransporter adhesin